MNGVHQKYRMQLVMSKPLTFDDAISNAQQIDFAFSGEIPLVHTGLTSMPTAQLTQIDLLREEINAFKQEKIQEKELIEMREELSTLRKGMKSKEGSSAAIGSQQSTLQAAQLNPQLVLNSQMSPQFSPQCNPYQFQAAHKKTALKVNFKTPESKVLKLSPLKSNRITSCSIVSPPVQQVVMVKANSPHKITEVRIPSPPIQQVVTLKVAPVHKVVETPILTAPIQLCVFANRPSQEARFIASVTAYEICY